VSPAGRPTLVVVGASGYLGRRVMALARARYRVIATYHTHPRPGAEGMDAPAGEHTKDEHAEAEHVDDNGTQWRALDVRDSDAIDSSIADADPAVVINCAYVQHGPDVDAITATAPGRLAAAARRAGARFVHLSSDVVFPGRTDRAYHEDDEPAPVHDYGRAKWRAERLVFASHPTPLVIRTSLLYGGALDSPGAPEGPQERMVRAALAGDDIWFFTGEVRNPIPVDVLASAILELVGAGHHGLLHVAGADAVDRLTFAQLLATAMHGDAAVLRGRPPDASSAPRPGNVALDCTNARAILRDTALTGVHEALSRRD